MNTETRKWLLATGVLLLLYVPSFLILFPLLSLAILIGAAFGIRKSWNSFASKILLAMWIVVAPFPLYFLLIPARDIVIPERQGCTNCGSSRLRLSEKGRWGTSWKSPSYSGCSHEWIRYGNALVQPVPRGRVVLLKKGERYGAFILRSCETVDRSELASYDWCHRADGKGDFTPAATLVTGTGTLEAAVRFDVFSVSFSKHTTNSIWLYYEAYPDEVSAGTLSICVTDHTSFESIDASDEKWVYQQFKKSFKDPLHLGRN